MLLPDGYSDVPRGKIAAVVTHLEMTERPAIPRDPAGAWTLRRVEAPELDWFRDRGQCELRLFGVTAKLIGSGAGRWLMNRALELMWSRPVTRVWVHTCTFDHPAALAFYQRSGFRPFRRQVEISDDPRLDGTAPRGAAKHVPMIE